MDEEHSIGDWLQQDAIKLMAELRIAHEGYPECEAKYTSVNDFENQTGKSFFDILNP